MKINWVKWYFAVSLLLIVFIFGIVAGNKRLFPHDQLLQGWVAAKDWLKDNNFIHYFGIRPEKFIRRAKHEGAGVTVYVPEKTQPGVTLLTGMWDDTNGINLIDLDGSVIHEWRVSFNKIFPDASHLQRPISDWDAAIHGAHMYPNGDVLFNFDNKGLVKIDKCSNVVWKMPYLTHHSIYEEKGGNLWVPVRKNHDKPHKKFPLLKPKYVEEFLLKISPDGKILRKISLLEVFFNSGKYMVLSATGKLDTRLSGNFTHFNDIEILEENMADQFPLFNAGDIMVSIRNQNMIVVIDSVTEKIKWWMQGPFGRQHDPDFLPDGTISLFDNQSDNADGKDLGGSRILNIDPVTRKVKVVYKGNKEIPFYTEVQGKHQHLANGNILITESLSGRAFEITSSGEIVWSYINRYDEDEVYRLSQAARVDNKYGNFARTGEACPQN